MLTTVIQSINVLEEYKIKNCKYNGIDDKTGNIYQKSESGEEFNIMRYIEHKFSITLQYLTYEECSSIIKELITTKENRKTITISKNKIIKKGYLDCKKVEGEPSFYFDLKEVKPKMMTGKPFYELSINLDERVDVL